jgi:2'-5' RNA ligase
MRTFIAVELQKDIVEAVDRFLTKTTQEIKNNKISWVKKENLHITIKFLGEIEEKQLETINEVLSEISKNIKSFEVEIKEIGVFPNLNHPRVVWVGVKDEANNLVSLANLVEEKLAKFGFQKEDKEFTAHLTIGRVKKLNNLGEIKTYVEKYKSIEFGKSKIDSITFFQSILRPEGPEYKVINKFFLHKI